MNEHESKIVDDMAKAIDPKMLATLTKKRSVKIIPPHIIRTLFMSGIKECVSKLPTTHLGMICGVGTADEVKDLIVLPIHTSCVTLKTNETGLTMLQKIATSILIVRIEKLINKDQPSFSDEWDYYIIPYDQMDNLIARGETVAKTLGW